MLALLENLRALRVEVVAFDAGGSTDEEHELGMAHALMEAARQRPKALLIVLTGNLHASRKPVEGFSGGAPMACCCLRPKR